MFTYRDAVFAPGAAAAEALRHAEAAEAALRRKDEEALQAFVVGQLPRAIKRAWVSLEDWKAAVNPQDALGVVVVRHHGSCPHRGT